MRLLGRALQIFGAYLVAALAAGFALSASFILGTMLVVLVGDAYAGRLNFGPNAGQGFSMMFGVIIFGGVASSVLIFLVALVPAAIVIVISEVRSWRSSWYYCLAGAAGGALIFGCLEGFGGFRLTGGSWPWAFLFGGIAGLAAGLVYWALAGREAGAWRESEARQARTDPQPIIEGPS